MSGKHPMQPTIVDDRGVLRFQSNAIVEQLLKHGQATGLDLNELARAGFDREDWVQFNQIIGYSVAGCPMMTPAEQDVVDRMTEAGEDETTARMRVAEEQLRRVRQKLKDGITDLFDMHPDDLTQNLSGVI